MNYFVFFIALSFGFAMCCFGDLSQRSKTFPCHRMEWQKDQNISNGLSFIVWLSFFRCSCCWRLSYGILNWAQKTDCTQCKTKHMQMKWRYETEWRSNWCTLFFVKMASSCVNLWQIKYRKMQNKSFKPFHAVAVIALAGVFIKIHSCTMFI